MPRLSLTDIRTKTAFLILVLLAATTFASYAITVRIMDQHVTDKIIRTAESLGRSLAPAAGFLMGAQDLLGLDYMVFQVKKTNPDIRSVGVLGPGRAVIVHSDIKERGRIMEAPPGEVLKKGDDGTLVRRISASSWVAVLSAAAKAACVAVA